MRVSSSMVAMLTALTVGLGATPALAVEPGASSEATASGATVEHPAEDSPTEPRTRRPGDRMVQAGVGLVVAGLAGYGLMAAGLGIGNRAESDLLALSGRDDIETRREVLDRGLLGNRLAIGGAITATVALAVGIPLIAIGRRRHEASLASAPATIVVGGVAGGFGLRVRGRF